MRCDSLHQTVSQECKYLLIHPHKSCSKLIKLLQQVKFPTPTFRVSINACNRKVHKTEAVYSLQTQQAAEYDAADGRVARVQCENWFRSTNCNSNSFSKTLFKFIIKFSTSLNIRRNWTSQNFQQYLIAFFTSVQGLSSIFKMLLF